MDANLLTAVAYPFVVLVLGIIFLFTFKKELKSLLSRTSKLGPLETMPNLQELPGKSATDELIEALSGPLIENQKKLLLEEMEKRKVTGPEREKLLLIALARQLTSFDFERACHTIYGSQLAALGDLNAVGDAGRELAYIEKSYYQRAASQHLEQYKNYSFQNWLGFLQSFKFIAVESGKARIALEGREFLKYLIHAGHSLQRPF